HHTGRCLLLEGDQELTRIENRIRWSGLMIVLGLIVLLLSLLSAHPLAFMVLLAVGCPLIFVGVLLYLWALAGGEGSGGANIVLIAFLVLPMVISGCGGDSVPSAPADNSGGGLPVFDPSTATAKVSGKLILEGTAPAMRPLTIGRDAY